VTAAGNPRFSVIIATYNWSAALRVALESVRGQTESDFEVLVVGDACNDDSEAVVRSFDDPRFIWTNLPENCGSQWGPNNHGLELARGEYIAYLGHDDLWWPTHLETARGVFERTGADMVAAATLLYGPPGSGVRAVTGLFPRDTYGPRHFAPPSSLCHRRELAQRAGGWRPPDQSKVSVDYDFLARCHESGARIVPTGEFTAFKFNASWRRDSYRLRDASEQRECLARMRREGERFRSRELSEALRAATDDRLHRIEVPIATAVDTARVAAGWYAFKGSRRTPRSSQTIPPGERLRFPPESEYSGFEWHSLETHASLGQFHWSGPSPRSTTVLPVRIDRPLEVTVLVVGAITPDSLRLARLEANGVEVETRIAQGPENTLLWSAGIVPGQLPANDRDELRLTMTVDGTHRPFDLGVSEDRRWLGIAVGWIEVG